MSARKPRNTRTPMTEGTQASLLASVAKHQNELDRVREIARNVRDACAKSERPENPSKGWIYERMITLLEGGT